MNMEGECLVSNWIEKEERYQLCSELKCNVKELKKVKHKKERQQGKQYFSDKILKKVGLL